MIRSGNSVDKVSVNALPSLYDQVRAYVPAGLIEKRASFDGAIVQFDDTTEAREVGQALIAAADALDRERAHRRTRSVTITGTAAVIARVETVARGAGAEVSS